MALSLRNTNVLGENAGKENARPRNSKAGPQKRSALGCVTNQVRVQPVRAAKDKVIKVLIKNLILNYFCRLLDY